MQVQQKEYVDEAISVRVFRNFSDLRAISGEWQQALQTGVNNNIFLTWDWLAAWIEIFSVSHRLLCLGLFVDNKLTAIAPFCVATVRFCGFVPLRILRFIGSTEVCSDYLDLIMPASRKDTRALTEVMWRELVGPLAKEWDVFEYHNVPANSVVLDSLIELADNDHRCIRANIVGYTVCPYIRLPETREAYLQQINIKRRRAYEASKEILEKRGKLELRICNDAAQFPREMERLITIHRQSWNQRGEQGSFATADFVQFHLSLARELLSQGKLFLASLWLDDQHIGSLYGFEHNKTLHAYLGGAQRDFAKGATVGRVLIGMCIEQAIERGCREFDFLRGAEQYKYDWTDVDRRNLSVTFFNRRLNALAFLLWQDIRQDGKRVAKAVLGSRGGTVSHWLKRSRQGK
jgi:CelD/BcsL family acetyltransferase involved in cellulose biosynthesis